MDGNLFKYNRRSFIEISEVFFQTATINQWQELLLEDELNEKNFSFLKDLRDVLK
ncbi:hypothetical protein [Terrimonas alba]|uniref:hypothetical protein n=1 Tax=Terrimonas alba TaxID=3349636 RepID=UPI0035F4EA9A